VQCRGQLRRGALGCVLQYAVHGMQSFFVVFDRSRQIDPASVPLTIVTARRSSSFFGFGLKNGARHKVKSPDRRQILKQNMGPVSTVADDQALRTRTLVECWWMAEELQRRPRRSV